MDKTNKSLPLDNIEVMENDLLFVLGGCGGKKKGKKTVEEDYGCGCKAGIGCGCKCSNGSGCGCGCAK